MRLPELTDNAWSKLLSWIPLASTYISQAQTVVGVEYLEGEGRRKLIKYLRHLPNNNERREKYNNNWVKCREI